MTKIVNDIALKKAMELNKNYTDKRITDLIGTAPTTLDTLGELATQLQNDQSAANALVNQLGQEITNRQQADALLAPKDTVYNKTEVDNFLKTKQNTLVAGSNITIDTTNTISAIIPSEYVTDSELNAKGYQTITQADSKYQFKGDYATNTQLNTKQDLLSTGNSTTSGTTKLYPSTGNNTDGSIIQDFITKEFRTYPNVIELALEESKKIVQLSEIYKTYSYWTEGVSGVNIRGTGKIGNGENITSISQLFQYLSSNYNNTILKIKNDYFYFTNIQGSTITYIGFSNDFLYTLIIENASFGMVGYSFNGLINTIDGKAKKVQYLKTSNNTFTISPNTFYDFGVQSTLSITLEEGRDTSILNEYQFQFSCGDTPTALTLLPTTIKWQTPIIIRANHTYQVNIINNLAVYGEWPNT